MARFKRKSGTVDDAVEFELLVRHTRNSDESSNAKRPSKCTTKEITFAVVVLILVLVGAIAIGLIYKREPHSGDHKLNNQDMFPNNTVKWKMLTSVLPTQNAPIQSTISVTKSPTIKRIEITSLKPRTKSVTAPSTVSEMKSTTSAENTTRVKFQTTTDIINETIPTTTDIMNKTIPITTDITNKIIPTTTDIKNKTIPTATDIMYKTIPTTTDITNKTIPTTTDITNKTIPTTTDIKNQTIPTTTDITTKTIPTTTDILNKTIPTTTDITDNTIPTPTGILEKTIPPTTTVTKKTIPTTTAVTKKAVSTITAVTKKAISTIITQTKKTSTQLPMITKSLTPVVVSTLYSTTNNSVVKSTDGYYLQQTTPRPNIPEPVTIVEGGKEYNIMSYVDGRLLDGHGGGFKQDGTPVGLWPHTYGLNQRFSFDKVDTVEREGYPTYRITELMSKKPVVYRPSANNIAGHSGTIQIYDADSVNDQFWTVEEVPKKNKRGLYQIENILVKKCLELNDTIISPTYQHDTLTLRDCTDNDSQLWRIIPVCKIPIEYDSGFEYFSI